MKKKYTLLLLLPLLFTSCSDSPYDDFVYANEGYIKLEGSSLELDNITDLTVDWINGSISCVQGNSSLLSFSESTSDYPLYYRIIDNSLTIKVAESGTSSRVISNLNKDLTLTVPSLFNGLNIEAIKTKVEIKNEFTIKDGTFSMVDASLVIDHYRSAKTAFNLVNVPLTINHLDIDKDKNYSSTSLNIVNRNATIGIKEENGYHIDWSGVNSTFASEYEDEKDYGDHKVRMGCKVVNGKVNIKKIA